MPHRRLFPARFLTLLVPLSVFWGTVATSEPQAQTTGAAPPKIVLSGDQLSLVSASVNPEGAQAAIDGDEGTSWKVNGPWPQEIVLELPENHRVTALRYIHGNRTANYLTQYRIYASADGQTWTNTSAPGTIKNTTLVWEIRMSWPKDARFVKLIFMGSGGGSSIQAAEIQVISDKVTPPPSSPPPMPAPKPSPQPAAPKPQPPSPPPAPQPLPTPAQGLCLVKTSPGQQALSSSALRNCNDGVDNNNDGKTDLEVYGCIRDYKLAGYEGVLADAKQCAAQNSRLLRASERSAFCRIARCQAPPELSPSPSPTPKPTPKPVSGSTPTKPSPTPKPAPTPKPTPAAPKPPASGSPQVPTKPNPGGTATRQFGPGRYVITNPFVLTSNQILRGAGSGKTVLYFPKGLVGMGACKSPCEWGHGVIKLAGSNVRVEGLTIEFPPHKWTHHGGQGYNGLFFSSCNNCSARDVVVRNSDQGVSINFGQGNRVENTAVYANPGYAHYHYAFTGGRNSTVNNFKAYGNSVHGLTGNWGPENVTFSNGWGEYLRLEADHNGPATKNMVYQNISGKIKSIQSTNRARKRVSATFINIGGR
jgi:hypothetical protein